MLCSHRIDGCRVRITSISDTNGLAAFATTSAIVAIDLGCESFEGVHTDTEGVDRQATRTDHWTDDAYAAASLASIRCMCSPTVPVEMSSIAASSRCVVSRGIS